MHVSDVLQKVDFRKGTHLAIGEGSVDFKKLLKYFDKFLNMFGALEIKGDNRKMQSSLKYMREFYLRFPNSHALSDELSWTHYRLLLKVDKSNKVYVYA